MEPEVSGASDAPSGRLAEIVGLIPAAGLATRIAPLPCSKEIFPVGFHVDAEGRRGRPKVAAHYLLERMQRAGVRKAYIVLRGGKWDIPAYFGDGHRIGLHLAYLMMRLPHGAPFTLSQAYPFVRDARVLLGFPDILIQPEDAFVHLLQKQATTGADIVLGLFPAHDPAKVDMVAMDAEGRVRSIVIKPAQTDLQYTWLIAAWTPVFTRFMQAYVARMEENLVREDGPPGAEVFVGHVIQQALDGGLHVESVVFPDGSYIDIGTPEDLARAVRGGI